MQRKQTTQFLTGALSLIAAGSPGLHGTPSVLAAEPMQQNINLLSLKSIEGSWLKVPVKCKAMGFHANPTTLTSKTASPLAKSLYSFYAV